jgi:hypothetical protein
MADTVTDCTQILCERADGWCDSEDMGFDTVFLPPVGCTAQHDFGTRRPKFIENM